MLEIVSFAAWSVRADSAHTRYVENRGVVLVAVQQTA